jgi:glucose/mannose transport system substrate-binding protein
MTADLDATVTWTLAHAWHSDSDHAALNVCAAELAKLGIGFAGTSNLAEANAVKMHGFEIIDALHASNPRLADLRGAAASQGWSSLLDPRALRFMGHRDAVFGIPLNLHQSNCLWAHKGSMASIDSAHGQTAQDLDAWLRQAAIGIAKPLAIGSEPWQIGILFESLALGIMGAERYEEAFVQLHAAALGGRAMVDVLELLKRWREFVDNDRITLPWRDQLAAVNAGEAAVMVMGDWVSAGPPVNVQRLHLDGFRGENIFVVDFFVPVLRGGIDLAERVASALTSADFQTRFSAVKGSTPAVIAAQRTRAQSERRVDAPSLTFDQCCSVATKSRLLDIVADHFIHRRDSARTAAALASTAQG